MKTLAKLAMIKQYEHSNGGSEQGFENSRVK